MTDPQPARPAPRTLLITLAAVAVVLLGASIVLGLTTARLLDGTSAEPPQPTRSPDDGNEPAQEDETLTQPVLSSQGFEVRVNSEFTIDELAIGLRDAEGYTAVYAPIRLPEADDRTGRVHFDVTIYDADGRILDRSPTNTSWMKDQTRGIIGVDVRHVDFVRAAEIRIEQTMYEEMDYPLTGTITVGDVQSDEYASIAASIDSTLSVPLETARMSLAGYVDGELFGVCDSVVDTPSGGSFAVECFLNAVGTEPVAQETITVLPEGAEFVATLDLPPTFGN